MTFLKGISSQQLVLAACCSILVVGTMGSDNLPVKLVLIGFAVLCGLGAFAKAKDR